MFIGLKEHEKRARVHFIPALKDEVFVTLRAPEVIRDEKALDVNLKKEFRNYSVLDHKIYYGYYSCENRSA